MPQDEFRLFLSAVSSEFGKARDALAADLRSRELLLRVQSDFRQEPESDTTLKKLHDYIRDCSAVVCVIGKCSGALPPPPAAEPFKHVLPSGIATASYTQWVFARHFKRRLSIYIAKDDHKPDREPASEDDPALQQAFLAHIVTEQGLDRSYFSNEDQLCRAVLKEDWPKKRQGEEIWAGYIDEWAHRCDLDGWTGWSSFVLGGDRPQMTVARDHELEELGPWLLGRIWPAGYPTVERAFANFRVVLQDFRNTFHKHAEKPTPDNDWLLTVKFYQIKEWDEERYERLGKAYSFHVALVQDLMLELTRAANLICDEVRSSIMPTFRLAQGRIMVESGPHLPDVSWRTFTVHYSPEEKGQLMPYPGLKAFKQARFARDRWFGDPKSEYCRPPNNS